MYALTAESKKSCFSTGTLTASAKDLVLDELAAGAAIMIVFKVFLSVNKNILLVLKESV